MFWKGIYYTLSKSIIGLSGSQTCASSYVFLLWCYASPSNLGCSACFWTACYGCFMWCVFVCLQFHTVQCSARMMQLETRVFAWELEVKWLILHPFWPETTFSQPRLFLHPYSGVGPWAGVGAHTSSICSLFANRNIFFGSFRFAMADFTLPSVDV